MDQDKQARDPLRGEGRAVTGDSAVNQCAEDPSARDRRAAERVVDGIIARRQGEFQMQVAVALNRASMFANSLSKAMGHYISRDEAINALKADIAAELERLR